MADPDFELSSTFVERLVQARLLRGQSQRAVGVLLGLDKSQAGPRVNRYERKRTSVTMAGLEALAKALNVPPAYLVSDSAEMADAILLLADGRYGGADPALLELLRWVQASPDLHASLRQLLDTPTHLRPTAEALAQAIQAALKQATPDP